MKIGDSAAQSLKVSEEVVQGFGDLIGDRNPIHFDDSFAKSTRFGRRIAHGMISASLISAVIGTKLPGPGSIYINQSLQFTGPVYIGDEVVAQVKIVELRQDKPIVKLETVCTNQDGTIVLKGEAVVAFPQPANPEA